MELYVAQSGEMLNNKLSDLEVLFQLQLRQIGFAKSLPFTLRFSNQTAGLNAFPFLYFANRSVTQLKPLPNCFLCLDLLSGTDVVSDSTSQKGFIKSFLWLRCAQRAQRTVMAFQRKILQQSS